MLARVTHALMDNVTIVSIVTVLQTISSLDNTLVFVREDSQVQTVH